MRACARVRVRAYAYSCKRARGLPNALSAPAVRYHVTLGRLDSSHLAFLVGLYVHSFNSCLPSLLAPSRFLKCPPASSPLVEIPPITQNPDGISLPFQSSRSQSVPGDILAALNACSVRVYAVFDIYHIRIWAVI